MTRKISLVLPIIVPPLLSTFDDALIISDIFGDPPSGSVLVESLGLELYNPVTLPPIGHSAM